MNTVETLENEYVRFKELVDKGITELSEREEPVEIEDLPDPNDLVGGTFDNDALEVIRNGISSKLMEYGSAGDMIDSEFFDDFRTAYENVLNNDRISSAQWIEDWLTQEDIFYTRKQIKVMFDRVMEQLQDEFHSLCLDNGVEDSLKESWLQTPLQPLKTAVTTEFVCQIEQVSDDDEDVNTMNGFIYDTEDFEDEVDPQELAELLQDWKEDMGEIFEADIDLFRRVNGMTQALIDFVALIPQLTEQAVRKVF